MNIFYLHTDPRIAAQQQCDKHVVKMTLESAQLLCTAHHELATPATALPPILYKPTHRNHPCSVWARSSAEAYYWLYEHFCALANEYTYRYAGEHLSYTKLRDYLGTAPLAISLKDAPPVPLAMPSYYHNSDPVQAYRAYYREAKMSILAYTRRSQPEWLSC